MRAFRQRSTEKNAILFDKSNEQRYTLRQDQLSMSNTTYNLYVQIITFSKCTQVYDDVSKYKIATFSSYKNNFITLWQHKVGMIFVSTVYQIQKRNV